jgi:hypothetical protein
VHIFSKYVSAGVIGLSVESVAFLKTPAWMLTGPNGKQSHVYQEVLNNTQKTDDKKSEDNKGTRTR